MATSGLQLLGFFLSLVGAAATVAATVMVEWKKLVQGKHRSYEGLWMSCGGVQDRATCESYQSIMKLPSFLIIIITSWFVKIVVKNSYGGHHMIRPEFGNAVFVSWVGGLLSAAGGAFLSCRRCWRSKPSVSRSSNHLLPTSNTKSNYV